MNRPPKNPGDSDADRDSPAHGQSARKQRGKPLTPELVEQIEAVHGVIGPYLGLTLEKLEIDLLQSPSPKSRAIVWIRITAAWDDYHVQFLDGDVLDEEQEAKIVAALVQIAEGQTDPAKLPVATDVGARLIACYEGIVDE